MKYHKNKTMLDNIIPQDFKRVCKELNIEEQDLHLRRNNDLFN